MAVELRQARAGDVDALLAIENAVFQTDGLSRTSFRRLVAGASATVIVAETGGQVAGYCIILFRATSPAARLYSIAVDPGRSGQGIGRMLIGAAEAAAKTRSRSLLRLEVRNDNPRAIAIYRQSGFQKTGSRPGYYEDGMSAICMTKGLAHDDASASGAERKETNRGNASFSRRTDKIPRRAAL